MRPQRLIVSIAALAASLFAALAMAGVAQAAGPERFGPFVNDYAEVGISCDGFDIFIEGTETRTATVFRDEQGEVIRVIERVSAAHDVLTNTITGDSIVVRAHFTHFDERVSATDTFTRAITGFRYFVNQAGEGVLLRDVGRIVYATVDQEAVLFSAGAHELAFDADVEASLCDALA